LSFAAARARRLSDSLTIGFATAPPSPAPAAALSPSIFFSSHMQALIPQIAPFQKPLRCFPPLFQEDWILRLALAHQLWQ
jgi:hypothetical protein